MKKFVSIKKIFVMLLVSTLIFSINPIIIRVKAESPDIVYVDDDFNENTSGWGYDHFDKISNGTDAVAENGTVYVNSGMYEAPRYITTWKTLSVIGENKETTIIDGEGVDYGVIIWGAPWVEFSGFTIKNCQIGIIATLSWSAKIFNNIISDNSDVGLDVLQSSYVQVYENEIQYNNIGIRAVNYQNRKIFHNNFIGNTQNAHGESSDDWDDGYPSGGNYWEDYDGIDDDDDGIGDTPYDIPGGDNQDRYPLMNLYSDTGNYDISSTPGGANIYIDAEYKGQTPNFISGISIGEHNIKLTKGGYQDYTDIEYLYGGRTLVYDVILTPIEPGVGWIYGTVRDNTSAPIEDAYVCVIISGTNNTECTYTDDQGHYSVLIPTGTHSVETSKQGYQSQIIHDVTVGDNHSIEVNFILTKIEGGQTTETGSYDISSEPSDADIYIDDVYYGKTPKIITGMPTGAHVTRLTKSGYQDWSDERYLHVNETITYDVILTLDENEPFNGWIFGSVTNYSGLPLEDALIYIVIGDTNTTRCTYTNENGIYNISISPGTYDAEAGKEGYQFGIAYDIVVNPNTATEINFILEESIESGNETGLRGADANEQLIEEKILPYIKNDKVAAKIRIDSEAETISYYSDEVLIELNKTKEMISFTVGAEDGTRGTILIIRIGEGVLSDLDNLTVTYDGEPIDEFIDIEEFFVIEEDTVPGWLRLLTITGLYVLIRIPHFSEHTITITSIVESVGGVVEAIGGITAVILYIVVFAIVAILYIAPILFIEKKK